MTWHSAEAHLGTGASPLIKHGTAIENDALNPEHHKERKPKTGFVFQPRMQHLYVFWLLEQYSVGMRLATEVKTQLNETEFD